MSKAVLRGEAEPDSARVHPTGFYDEHDADNSNGLNNLSQRYDDLYFTQNMNRATSAGLFAGPYHFGRLNSGENIPTDAVDEANDFVDAIQSYYQTPNLVLRPVLDYEQLPNDPVSPSDSRSARLITLICMIAPLLCRTVCGGRTGRPRLDRCREHAS